MEKSKMEEISKERMKQIMFQLLTYQPFQIIRGQEKNYIDSILGKKVKGRRGNLLPYSSLFTGFVKYCQMNKASEIEWLKNWIEEYRKGSYNKGNSKRTYPILLKKIVYYIILNNKLKDNYDSIYKGAMKTVNGGKGSRRFENSDESILKLLNLEHNIMEKWKISPRYRFLSEENTYISFKLYRNGIKKPYLVSAIKKAYYEAGRQLLGNQCGKKKSLPTFVDVFGGTGSVGFSMDAPKTIINDYDKVMACFLFSFTYYNQFLKKLLCELHTIFLNRRLSDFSKANNDDDMLNDMVFNYQKIEKDLETLRTDERYNEIYFSTLKKDLSGIELVNRLKSIGLFLEGQEDGKIDIDEVNYVVMVAAYWFFLNGIKKGTNKGNRSSRFDISMQSYKQYLLDTLGIENKKIKVKKLTDLRNIKLLSEDINFGIHDRTRLYSLSNKIEIRNMDFCELFNHLGKEENFPKNTFFYFDSPYFLTLDYNISFQDDLHKGLLDIVRNTQAKWIFSMQYYLGNTDKINNSQTKKERQNNNKAIIPNYATYYHGFIQELVPNNTDKVYVTNDREDSVKVGEKMKNLWVIFFNNRKKDKLDYNLKEREKTKEILICNFDVRNVFPYNNTEIVVPFSAFLELVDNNTTYMDICKKGLEIREKGIKEYYEIGETI